MSSIGLSQASAAVLRAIPQDLVEEHNRVTRLAETASFITRDPELQKAALLTLFAHLETLAKTRDEFEARAQCDSANAALALICLVKAIAAEIEMWRLLRQSEAEAAWDRLVEAQDFCEAAGRAHACGVIGSSRRAHLGRIEAEVFPPQVFQSAGYIANGELCSICSGDYRECDHMKGLPYCGRWCYVTIKKVHQLREVSIVEHPADKRCRVVRFSEDGRWRNRMTWKLEDARVGREAGERTAEGIAVRTGGYPPIVP